MRKVKNFLVGLLIVVGIFVLIWGIIFFKDKYDKSTANKALQTDAFEDTDYDEYLEELKNVDSDIEGLSKYDKHEMGLSVQDNADSDYDGLTDKEEIELYGSDPTRASTSGDLYTDGYKVANGMDIDTYYEYEGEEIFSYNECPNIELKATEALDFFAVVKDYTGKETIDNYDVLREYNIYNYGGIVTIDLSEALSANDMSIDDMDLLVSYGFELESFPVKKDGNKLITKKALDRNEDYKLYIVKKSVIGSAGLLLNGSLDGVHVVDANDITGKAFISGSPLIAAFTGWTIHGYYEDLGNDVYNETLKKKVSDNFEIQYTDYVYQENRMEPASVEKIESLIAIFENSPLSVCRLETNRLDVTLPRIFFSYMVYDPAEIAEENYVPNGGFDMNKDELPFANFNSCISPGGNCAGMAYLTARLFNRGTIPYEGEYYISNLGQTVSWDLTTDVDNTTLTDKGLSDYKDADFINNKSEEKIRHTVDNSFLSDGEQQFVNMIGCYWREANDRISINDYTLEHGAEYDFSMCERMMEYLDSGKILQAAFRLPEGAHAVNIYGYRWLDEDNLAFYVYDSNLPQDHIDSIRTTESPCAFKIKRKLKPSGDGYTFLYVYYPIKGNTDYIATSDRIMPKHALIVYDDEWNILNDKSGME